MEDEEVEKEFKIKLAKKELNLCDITFKELYEEFYNYKLDKVKKNTLYGYIKNIGRLEYFMKIKIKDLSIKDYIIWRNAIVQLPLAVKTKNDYHKLLKCILNYGIKWHDFNFTTIYNKNKKIYDKKIYCSKWNGKRNEILYT